MNQKPEEVSAMEPKWSSCFTPWIFSRGRRLWQEKRVRRLDVNQDTVAAIVDDREDCFVAISLNEDGSVRKLGCSCLFADDGSPCCHMVTALLALEDRTGEPVRLPDARDQWWKIRRVNWNPESTRRWADYAVRRRKEIYQAIDTWASRPGRRSEKVLSETILSLLEATVLPQISRGQNLDAFQVICITLETVLTREMELSDLQVHCSELWMQLKRQATPQERDKMYQWFSQYATRSFAVRTLLFDPDWEPEQVRFTLTSLAPPIFRQGNELADGARLLPAMLRMIRSLHWSWQQTCALFRQLPGWALHCSVAIMNLEPDRTQDGLTLLRLCRETTSSAQTVLSQCRRFLTRVYQEGAVSREDLVRLFTFPVNSRAMASTLRDILSKEDWSAVVTQLLQDPAWDSVRLDLLMLDARLPELYAELEKRGSLQDLNRCAPILEQWSASNVRNLYAELAIDLGRHLTSTKDCRTLMNTLRKLASYNGGETKVREVIRTLRQTAPVDGYLAQVLARYPY